MKSIIKNAFIEILSGIAQYNKDGGVITKDKDDYPITISFPTKSPNYAIVRYYWDNGSKFWEAEHYEGKPHGKMFEWYRNGNKHWKAEYYKGNLHGNSVSWYLNGGKYCEREYHYGEIIHEKYYRASFLYQLVYPILCSIGLVGGMNGKVR